MTQRSFTRGLAMAATLLVVLAVTDGALHALLAQNPFGGPRPAPEPQVGGVFGWLLARQSEFYREISAAIRAAKTDGTAVWTLLAVSFAYGIFHAAGPGHGKAVISSYLVANRETAWRGIALSFASALMQSLVAVAIVGIGAWLLNVTSQSMCGAEKVIEIVSYALIAAFGARLLWSKGGSFFRAVQAHLPQPAIAGVPHQHGHDHGHHHDHGRHHDHGHHHHRDHHHEHDHDHHHDHGHHHHGHAHAGAHVHDEHCGHSHGPEPSELAGPGGWRRGLGAIFTVGIRPCSGAILVLVFALAQGLFWAGIAATFVMGIGTAITVATIAIVAVSARGVAQRLSAGRDGNGMLFMRGIEFGAAALVMLFGLGLLFGYLAAERVTCF